MNIECDTRLVEDTARNILSMISDYEVLINNYFKRLSNLPSTGEWIGQNAQKYCDLVSLDKELYLKYGEHLKDIANEMLEFSRLCDSTIQENERECEFSRDIEVDL